jgi:hypothetical protein
MKTKYFFLITSLLLFTANLKAQGDLLITPKRVVFEGSRQKEELSLVNIGKDSATYSVSFVQKKMREDGSFETIDKSEEVLMAADPYLRIFPRQVTLAPGEAQVIMLQCRRRPDMKSGEYRSHLYFRAEKHNTPLGMENNAKDTARVSVKLIPVFGLSIPVIIHSGEIQVSSTITDLKVISLNENMLRLNLILNRTGNISAYGDIRVEFIPSRGKSVSVGSVRGIGVYTSISKRNITLDLNDIHGISLKNGVLKVLYTSQDGVKYEVFAESQISL